MNLNKKDMVDRKYVLTDETREFNGHILHRIRAIKDFDIVRKGENGGWVESEDNLSQDGHAWVSGEAMVFGNALVTDNAWVTNKAIIYDSARVCNKAIVCGNAKVYDVAWVTDNVIVSDNAIICAFAKVCGHAAICGDAVIQSESGYVVYKNTWSSFRYFTWTQSNNKWRVGCFYGTGEELIAKAYKDSEKSGKCYEAIVKAQEIISNVK